MVFRDHSLGARCGTQNEGTEHLKIIHLRTFSVSIVDGIVGKEAKD